MKFLIYLVVAVMVAMLTIYGIAAMVVLICAGFATLVRRVFRNW